MKIDNSMKIYKKLSIEFLFQYLYDLQTIIINKMKTFNKILLTVLPIFYLAASQNRQVSAQPALATIDAEVAIIPWLKGCRLHPLYGYCYDFGGVCKNKNTCCKKYFDIFTGKFKCGCQPCKGCHFNYLKHRCEDASGICTRSQCCKYIYKSDLFGNPICKCVQRDSPIGAPCSQCQWNGQKCIDQTNQCNPANGQCCKHYKYGKYQGPGDIVATQASAYASFLPVYKYYGICLCRKDPNSCQSCRFDKKRAQCVSTDGKCACCKLVEPYQTQPGTGLPKCYCQSTTQVCNNCQREDFNSLTCKGTCDNLNQCCKLVKTSLGVDICDCDSCPGCRYNDIKKKCENTGLCQFPDCCKQVGYQNGAPVCKCAPQKKQWCDTCVWNGQKCYDPLNKCTGDKCCVSKYNNQLCSCQICPVERKCRFNREQGKCLSIEQRCIGQNCCVLTGKLYSTGQPECQCIKSQDQKCHQCQFRIDSTGQRVCIDPTKICTGENCCVKQAFSNGLQYCSCQGCTQKRCYWDIFEGRCKDTGYCTGDDCCSQTRETDSQGYPICKCLFSETQDCGTCYFDPDLGQCIDKQDSCAAVNKKCVKYQKLGNVFCKCQ